MLSEFIGLVLEKEQESYGWLEPKVVGKLIKKYALDGGPKWEFTDLVATFGEEEADTFALFDELTQTMYIDRDVAADDIPLQVQQLLHEIRHWNQQQRWASSPAWRKGWMKGRKVPPGLEGVGELADYNKLIRLLAKLHFFWENEYSYDQAPHEVDAWSWSEKETPRAVEYVAGLMGVSSGDLVSGSIRTRGLKAGMAGIPEDEMVKLQDRAFDEIVRGLQDQNVFNPGQVKRIKADPEAFKSTALFRQYFRDWLQGRVGVKGAAA